MGCSCDSGGTTKAAEPSSAALKQSFRRFWPDHVPFPPVAPWLGASVTRVEAFDYVLRYAKRFPGLERGEFAAYAALASSILYSEEAEFSSERRRKKRRDPPDFPDPPEGGGMVDCGYCFHDFCSKTGQWVTCCYVCNDDGSIVKECDGDCSELAAGERGTVGQPR
jgi:hypothetical protein